MKVIPINRKWRSSWWPQIPRGVLVLAALLLVYGVFRFINRAPTAAEGLANLGDYLADNLLYLLPAFVVGSVLHELAHAYVAYLGGDPTGKAQGRLTLNPMKHLDPLGTVLIFLVGFGWARPVPIDRNRLRNPRRDFLLAAAAGPIANLLIAAVSILVLKLGLPLLAGVSPSLQTGFFKFFFFMAYINALLGVFNLIPIGPLDGSRILPEVLPPRTYYKYKEYENIIFLVFMFALLAGLFDGLFGGLHRMIMTLVS